MTMIDLDRLLAESSQHVKEELESAPGVVDVGDDLDLDQLAITKREWTRVDEIVAVVADLKDSTRLGTGKQHAASTASIYEAAVGSVAEIFHAFGADDMDIQGDCVIGIFWGDERLERAFCAGVTVKTFSERHLQEQLEEKWEDLPETGFKLGMAASRILVKKIGIPGKPDHQEEVWAGKAVNYAAKAAQCSDRNEMLVTGSVWDRLEPNDYITYSCGCNSATPTDRLWDEKEIEQLPDEQDRYGRKLKAMWCITHGPAFCAAILAGKTSRTDVTNARLAYAKKQTSNVLARKRKHARELRRARSA